MDKSRKIKSLGLVGLTTFAIWAGACSSDPSHPQPASIPLDKQASAASRNTEPASSLIAQGRKFFVQSCAHCHGADARGDEGPDLHDLPISDQRIAAIVKNGIKGEMPAFAQKYNDAEIGRLQAYVRSLKE